MPDKLTDSEIVKALKCCIELFYENNVRCDQTIEGLADDVKSIFADLINRLQAKLDEAEDTIQFADKELKKANTEFERLEAEIDKQYEIAEANVRAEIASGGTSCHWCEDKVRAEAYKEFVEKVETFVILQKADGYTREIVLKRDIDNLLKELVGEDK